MAAPAGARGLDSVAGVRWGRVDVERVMGIEPTLAAWEAAVLPLNYTRPTEIPYRRRTHSV